MNTICQTLLDSLFSNKEHTTPQQEIYSYVKRRIFPNPDEYILFLKLSDMNEKREVAKNIVKRLCMFSNYQPPYEIIVNVSQQEKGKKNQSINKNYIPQDHFVHIVCTYIFGVYLYFEHPSFSRELNLLFSDKRKGDNYLRKINAVNDFISSWKSFCLYHDLGYPFEIYYKENEVLKDSELSELSDFDCVFDHIKNQLSIKALAKLVVINSMIKETTKTRSFRDVSSILCYNYSPVTSNGADLNESNINFVNAYYELEDIYSYEHLKMFLGFINKTDVMKVLFYRVFGHPIAFAYSDHSENYIYKNIEVALPISDDELKFILSNDDMHYDSKFDSNYEIKYFVKCLEPSFAENLHGDITTDDLDNILELLKVEGLIQLDFKHINSESDLDSLIFEIYESLIKTIKTYLSSFTEEELTELKVGKLRNVYLANRKAVYQNYINTKISKDINSFLSADISKQNVHAKKLTDGLSNVETLNRSSFSPYIFEYIKAVFSEDGLDEITKHVVDQMMTTLQDEITRRNSLISSYATISNIINEECSEIRANNFIFNNRIEMKTLLDSAIKNNRIKIEFNEIASILLANKHVSIDDLIDKYRRFTKYDHGICSGILYLYINAVYSFLVEKINYSTVNFAKMLIPLFWAINPTLLTQKLLTNYKHIHKESFYAIFCHNIFSKEANEIFGLRDEKKWATRIDNEAFLYFSMLCDSLQYWDRERYYDPRVIDYNPLFAMDSYNVSIKNDKITIKTVAYTSNYDDIVKEFKYDDFLEDCSKYLSLEIKLK